MGANSSSASSEAGENRAPPKKNDSENPSSQHQPHGEGEAASSSSSLQAGGEESAGQLSAVDEAAEPSFSSLAASDDEDVEGALSLYAWIDQVPLSRRKKHFGRDMSDAVLAAETVHAYEPQLVKTYKYVACHATDKKEENWTMLNRDVLTKLGCGVTREEIAAVARVEPGAAERVMVRVQAALARRAAKRKKGGSSGHNRSPRGSKR